MLKKLTMLVAFGALAAAVAAYWVYAHIGQRASAPLNLTDVQVIEVERGDTVADVLNEMVVRGIVDDPRWLNWYSRLSKLAHRIHVGEFEVLPGDTWTIFLQRMAEGKVVQRQWTIVPGWTVREMLQSLHDLPVAHTQGLTEEKLPTLLNMSSSYAEGWFLPDTYAFVRGEQDLALLKRANEAMHAALAEAWNGRDERLPFRDAEELLIAASLVEKETGHPDDRGSVAAVFASRLRLGMRLQTDPTVIYGVGPSFDGNLTRKHLRTPGPYNTYMNHGLPPTPIALPGPPALTAAAAPSDVDFLYFVARGDGTSQFSRTLSEHQAAVRRYQLRRR